MIVATALTTGCGNDPPGGAASGVASSSAVAPELDTGDLADADVRTVSLDETVLTVAWADDAKERSQGLMHVEDLGDLDGMVFDLETERSVTFTMRNTLIPLDLILFDADGNIVGWTEMVPCEEDPCPLYPIDAPGRWALEVPAGTVDIERDSKLGIP